MLDVCLGVVGRSYLAKNSELIASLMTCLKMETADALTQDHTLGCLQRLSLKYIHRGSEKMSPVLSLAI